MLFVFLLQLDVFITVPLLVLTLRAQELTEISTLVACMQISCHEFLIMISSWILLRCGRNHFERIDAVGAWMIVHFLTLMGNVCLLTFEAWPEYTDLENTSLFVRLLLGWKLFFVFIEVIGMIYCYYIVHNPVTYITTNSSNSRNQIDSLPASTSANMHSTSTAEESSIQSVSHIRMGYDTNSRHRPTTLQRHANVGFSNRAATPPPPYTLNPAFESELSLDYANGY